MLVTNYLVSCWLSLQRILVASPFAVQVRIADEVNANLNLAAWLRECLENQMGAAVGTREKIGVDNKTVQSWRDVVKAIEALTACKIKLDINSKKMAESMTPEEELAAVKAYIRAMEPGLRGAFLRNELVWHESPSGGKSA